VSTRHLPVRPNLDQLKHQARDLLAAIRRGMASWPRLVLACRMTDAICRDDLETVRTLVTRHPQLLHEDARGVKGNWGPPMSYAANLGRTRMIEMLRGLGAKDLQFAFDLGRRLTSRSSANRQCG
jgi:hypothetical protein